jgi:hypothetical protein
MPGRASKISISLTPATGARTTRFCRPRLPPPKPLDRLMCCRPKFRQRRLSAVRLAHRLIAHGNPPCDPSRARRCHVHRIPRPTSVTIAIRPSWWDGMRGVVRVIWGHHEAEYFCRRHWTKPCVICPTGDATGSGAVVRAPLGSGRGRREAAGEGLRHALHGSDSVIPVTAYPLPILHSRAHHRPRRGLKAQEPPP